MLSLFKGLSLLVIGTRARGKAVGGVDLVEQFAGRLKVQLLALVRLAGVLHAGTGVILRGTDLYVFINLRKRNIYIYKLSVISYK